MVVISILSTWCSDPRLVLCCFSAFDQYELTCNWLGDPRTACTGCRMLASRAWLARCGALVRRGCVRVNWMEVDLDVLAEGGRLVLKELLKLNCHFVLHSQKPLLQLG